MLSLTEHDQLFYRHKLADFLPSRIIDVHTHVWLERFKALPDKSYRAVTWPLRVAKEQAVEELIKTYRQLFPSKSVTPLMFGFSTSPKDDFTSNNEYVSDCSRRHRFPALIFARPEWSGQELEDRIHAGGFFGAKVYLTLADACIPEKEIRIFDFLPHHQLDVLNRHGWLVMLHIPRDGRLGDPLNLRQMIEIEQQYPNVKVIIAHVGRAYCIEDVGDAFEQLSVTRNMCFDFSANTNAEVFTKLIRAVGPNRILFGSDLPITRMRMKRIYERGRYVNLVPPGLYGDLSNDANMREAAESEASQFTFFLYEQIDAFRLAALETDLSPAAVEAVFYGNAERLISQAGQRDTANK